MFNEDEYERFLSDFGSSIEGQIQSRLTYQIQSFDVANNDKRILREIWAAFASRMLKKEIRNVTELIPLSSDKTDMMGKYFHTVAYSLIFQFTQILNRELYLYFKHHKKLISFRKYFNNDRRSSLIKNCFEYRSILYTASKRKNKSKAHPKNDVYEKLFFNELRKIQLQNDDCDLRKAVYLMLRNKPGILAETIWIFGVKFNMKKSIEKFRKDEKEGKLRNSKVYFDDVELEIQARELCREIKPEYSKHINKYSDKYFLRK